MFDDRKTYAPLALFEYDHKPGSYCLTLTDDKMLEVMAVFEANGRYGNGYGWADVAVGMLRREEPELESRMGPDPEAGMFVAYGDDLEALKRLGTLLSAAFHDPLRLAELVKQAPWEYD